MSAPKNGSASKKPDKIKKATDAERPKVDDNIRQLDTLLTCIEQLKKESDRPETKQALSNFQGLRVVVKNIVDTVIGQQQELKYKTTIFLLKKFGETSTTTDTPVENKEATRSTTIEPTSRQQDPSESDQGRQDNETQSSEIQRLKIRVSELEYELEEKEGTIKARDTEIYQLKLEVTTQAKKEANGKLENQVKELQEEKFDLSRKLEEERKNRNSDYHSFQDLAAEKDKLYNENKRLVAEKEQLATERDRDKSGLNKLNELVDTQEQKLAALEETRKRYEALNTQVADARRQAGDELRTFAQPILQAVNEAVHKAVDQLASTLAAQKLRHLKDSERAESATVAAYNRIMKKLVDAADTEIRELLDPQATSTTDSCQTCASSELHKRANRIRKLLCDAFTPFPSSEAHGLSADDAWDVKGYLESEQPDFESACKHLLSDTCRIPEIPDEYRGWFKFAPPSESGHSESGHSESGYRIVQVGWSLDGHPMVHAVLAPCCES